MVFCGPGRGIKWRRLWYFCRPRRTILFIKWRQLGILRLPKGETDALLLTPVFGVRHKYFFCFCFTLSSLFTLLSYPNFWPFSRISLSHNAFHSTHHVLSRPKISQKIFFTPQFLQKNFFNRGEFHKKIFSTFHISQKNFL